MGWMSSIGAFWVAYQGEPFLLGMDPDRIPEFFAGTNWRVVTDVQTYGPARVAAVQLCI